jgi:hypothetical protein
MIQPIFGKLTEAEKIAFTTFRRNPKYFVRRNSSGSIKRAWKLMDERISPISYINDAVMTKLVKANYIELIPLNEDDNLDYRVVIKFLFRG